MKKIPIKDLDYIDLYAEKLRKDSSFFEQQKMLIESQMLASKSLFKNKFKGENFKEKAREYLKEIGILKIKEKK